MLLALTKLLVKPGRPKAAEIPEMSSHSFRSNHNRCILGTQGDVRLESLAFPEAPYENCLMRRQGVDISLHKHTREYCGEIMVPLPAICTPLTEMPADNVGR